MGQHLQRRVFLKKKKQKRKLIWGCIRSQLWPLGSSVVGAVLIVAGGLLSSRGMSSVAVY